MNDLNPTISSSRKDGSRLSAAARSVTEKEAATDLQIGQHAQKQGSTQTCPVQMTAQVSQKLLKPY